MPLDSLEAQAAPADVAELMDADVLGLILSHVDALTLARVAAVSTAWSVDERVNIANRAEATVPPGALITWVNSRASGAFVITAFALESVLCGICLTV